MPPAISTAPVGSAEEPRTAAPASHFLGWDHLELFVGNARAFSHLLAAGFGFSYLGYAGPETGRRDAASYLLGQGDVRLLVTAGLDPSSPICDHVRRHGDGVGRLVVSVDDVEAVVDAVVAGGGMPPERPLEPADGDGRRRAEIAFYGDTRLVFAERPAGGRASALSGDGLPDPAVGLPVGLASVDHVVGNVEQGRLDWWVAWCRRVLGLEVMRQFAADQISTEYSALRSTVVHDRRRVTMPINEPAPGRRKSQIAEYLESYGGPGVQHVALATADIVASVDELRRRGVRFLTPPASYYEDARRRCPDLDVAWGDLERLGILVDVDDDDHLLQVFTETVSDRPTLFVEVIERRGATGFGDGNFKALFEAIERQQARRGNL
ncbi:MAG: 4-hydroxyphenylpyruvate dioxygenase [Acidimicrobiales bacterium]